MRRIASSVRIAVVAILGILPGCDKATGNNPPGFTIALDGTTMSLGQGVTDSITITVTRTNLNQPVTLSIEGTVPPGVTTSFSQNPLPAGVSTTELRFTATGSAAPASATITLRVTSDGVADKAEEIDVTVVLVGSYTLGMVSPSLTVAQGGAADAIVSLTRSGGNASAVSLIVEGAPSGITATVPSPVSDRGAKLSITATGAVAPGTYPLTITGSAAGFTPNQTTQVSLVVILPGATSTISLPFCSGSLPIWFAYQNEGFAWQQVLPTANSFSFAATAKVAIAYVLQGGNEFQTNVFWASRDGLLLGFSDRNCGSKTLTGSVTGLTAGQTGLVVMGASTSSSASNFTLQGVPTRPLDILATRGTGDYPANPFDFRTSDRAILRRSQDLSSSIPAFDFAAAEAFVPATSNLTIAGFQSGSFIDVRNNLVSATATYGTIQRASADAGSVTLSSIPAAQLIAGDLHELFVDSYSSTGLVGHSVYAYFEAAADRTESLGPLMTTPTVTMPLGSPYARVRGQLPSQPEYPDAGVFFLQQGSSGTSNRRIVVLIGTDEYFGATPANWDFLVPDFSTVSGFSSSWMQTPGTPFIYYVEAYSVSESVLFGGLSSLGQTSKLAYRVFTSPTVLSLRRSLTLRGRSEPLGFQYFRR